MERRTFFRAALLASAVVGVESMQAQPASAFFWFLELHPPCLSLVEPVGETTITLNVTAGSRGAPGGFTIQWMKKSDYEANCNRWYSSRDPRLFKAVYAPNSCRSPYSLGCRETIQVTIGDFPADVCTNGGPLMAQTEYIFRTFAHGYSCFGKSQFSCDLCVATKNIGLPPI